MVGERTLHCWPETVFACLSEPHTVTAYLSTAVGVTLVKTGAPGVALDRSVNRESNAFMGSILDGVVNTEGDEAAGAEVAFTLGWGRRWESMSSTIRQGFGGLGLNITWSQVKGAQT